MPTFLNIAQDTVRESGTVSSLPAPLSMASQSGRLERFVYWVRHAYEDIQRQSDNWRWLQSEFSGTTIASVQDYDAPALGVASRFSHWVYFGADDPEQWSIYKTSEGRVNEGHLQFMDWAMFRRKALIGPAAEEVGPPRVYTIDPQDKVRLHPTPDGEYTIRGLYYRSEQVLVANDDVPEMPARFHIAIQWRALMMMAVFDEAPEQMPVWAAEYRRVIYQMNMTQLPRMKLAGPMGP